MAKRKVAIGILRGRQCFVALSVLGMFLWLTEDRANGQSYLTMTGIPSFTDSEPVENGLLNLSNGNLRIEIPLAAAPERGSVGFAAKLVYESRIWQIVTFPSATWQPTNVANSQGGWRFVTSADAGQVLYEDAVDPCDPGPGAINTFDGFTWIAPEGTRHLFNIQTQSVSGTRQACGAVSQSSGAARATDSSGFYMSVTNYTDATVFARDGAQVYPTPKDTNGNYFTTDGNGNVIDTLGRTLVAKTVNGSTTYYDVLNAQGTTSRYTVATTTVNVNTNFGQSGVTEYAGSFSAIQSVTLPDSTSYSFTYDSGTGAGNFGLLKSMTLRTGGVVNYTFTTFADSYGNRNRWTNTRSYGGAQWTYDPAVITTCAPGGVGCQQKVTVTKPSGDQAVHTYTLNNGAWNAQTDYYTGSASSGTLLMSLLTDYDFSNTCVPTPCTGASYIKTLRNTTVMPTVGGSSLTKKTEYSYDNNTYANTAEIREWNFYTGTAPATPDRKMDTVYKTDTSYINKNILNRPISVTVASGGGTWLAQTNTTYDSTTLTSITGVTHHDDTNFGTANTVRGNPTIVQRFIANGGSSASTTLYYDTTGQVTKITDPNGNNTLFSYADNFFTDNATIANPPAAYTLSPQTNAYLTQITPPLIGAATQGYYFQTGELASAQDQNGNNSYLHYIDSLNRLTHTYGPLINSNRAWSLTQYTSATQQDIYATVDSAMLSTNCTSCQHGQIILDTWGRLVTTGLVNDPDGQTSGDTTYDTSSRPHTVSNPHRSVAAPTDGLETPVYDGLSRVTQVTRADGNAAYTYYGADVSANGGRSTQICTSGTYGLGYPIVAVDEAGKKRQSWTDGLGRRIEVDEPDSSNSLTSTNTLGTCYQYDLQNNLTQVVHGTQTRTYAYDGLSRPTSSSTPESGTTILYYTTSGGALCSGNPGALCRRLDARSITTTYTYDALNRPTSSTYSDSTPALKYGYDAVAPSGCTPPTLTMNNPKGRQTSMCDGSGATSWSYDAAGHVLTEKRMIATVTKTLSYTYKLNGAIATVTYPSTRMVTYGYNAVGQPVSAVDTANSVNYATGAHFAPPGELSSALHGQVSGGFAGITESWTYNNRLLGTRVQATSSAGTALDLSYTYPTANDGNISSIVNNVTSGRTQTFTYDELLRLSTAQSQATSGTNCWGQSFGYDHWGNLLTVSSTKCSSPGLTQTTNGNNQLVGFGYDNSGNMLTEGSNTYGWNGENWLTSFGSVSYSYDGDGLRVKKSSGTLYWRSLGGNVLSETDLSGNTTAEYITFAGRQIARRDSSGNVFYYFADHLGSSRVIAQATGTICYDVDFLPFGGERTPVVNTCPQAYKFTGYERDSDSGLDYAMFRYYNSRLGRFMSGDLLAGRTADPQSLNRYAYVEDNPCSRVDPLGLSDCNFNIAINNTNLLTPQEQANAQNEIKRILGLANLGANFTNSSNADFTLNLHDNHTGFWGELYGAIINEPGWDTLGRNNGGGIFGPPTNSATVYVNSTEMAAAGMDMGTAIGRVMTHEFGHWALQMVHTYPTPGPLEVGIMSQGLDPALMTGMATLTPDQISRLRSRCQQRHPQQQGGPHSGGGAGGGSEDPRGGGTTHCIADKTCSGEPATCTVTIMCIN